MKKSLLAILLILTSTVIVNAQQSIHAGLFGGYGSKIKKPAIGVIGEISITEPWSASVSIANYFVEKNEFAKTSFLEFNANANYYFLTEGSLNIYGLAGIQIARSSVKMDLGGVGFGDIKESASKVGLNIGGGANLHIESNFIPFMEIKYTIGGAEQLGIFMGVKYSFR